MSYAEFLDRKAQLGGNHGFTPTMVPEFLFDFQRASALRHRREHRRMSHEQRHLDAAREWLKGAATAPMCPIWDGWEDEVDTLATWAAEWYQRGRDEENRECEEVVRSPALLENLAALEHSRWSGWMNYQDCAPEERRADWPRKARMAYAELTNEERESDRVEARKTQTMIAAAIAARRGRLGASTQEGAP